MRLQVYIGSSPDRILARPCCSCLGQLGNILVSHGERGAATHQSRVIPHLYSNHRKSPRVLQSSTLAEQQHQMKRRNDHLDMGYLRQRGSKIQSALRKKGKFTQPTVPSEASTMHHRSGGFPARLSTFFQVSPGVRGHIPAIIFIVSSIFV